MSLRLRNQPVRHGPGQHQVIAGLEAQRAEIGLDRAAVRDARTSTRRHRRCGSRTASAASGAKRTGGHRRCPETRRACLPGRGSPKAPAGSGRTGAAAACLRSGSSRWAGARGTGGRSCRRSPCARAPPRTCPRGIPTCACGANLPFFSGYIAPPLTGYPQRGGAEDCPKAHCTPYPHVCYSETAF